MRTAKVLFVTLTDRGRADGPRFQPGVGELWRESHGLGVGGSKPVDLHPRPAQQVGQDGEVEGTLHHWKLARCAVFVSLSTKFIVQL